MSRMPDTENDPLFQDFKDLYLKVKRGEASLISFDIECNFMDGVMTYDIKIVEKGGE